MQIQKGLVKYKDRTDIVCTYGLTEDGKQYYFLDGNSIPNGNIIASTVLVEAIDPMVAASNVGVIDNKGNVVLPFEHKSIKPIAGGLLLVEKAQATTPSVLEAIKLRSDPLAATKLVTTPATIKDKMNAKMGNNGRFVFNDQFSEATICDDNGHNLINNEFYSFIGIKNNERLYFSKNTVDSEVTEFSLMKDTELPVAPVVEPEGVVEEVKEPLDVVSTEVTKETIDGAMESKVDAPVSKFGGDITAADFENMDKTLVSAPVDEPTPVEEETEEESVDTEANKYNGFSPADVAADMSNTLTNMPIVKKEDTVVEEVVPSEEVVAKNEETVEEKADENVSTDTVVEEKVDEKLEEVVSKLDEEQTEEGTDEGGESVTPIEEVKEEEEALVHNDVVELPINVAQNTPKEEVQEEVSEEVTTEDVKENLDQMMAFDFGDNINYSSQKNEKLVQEESPKTEERFEYEDVLANTLVTGEYAKDEEEFNEVVKEEEFNDFEKDLLNVELDTDILAGSTVKADKIDRDSFGNNDFRVDTKDTIIEDVASTMADLIKLNKAQKEKIASYEAKFEQVVDTHKKVVDKARSQARDNEMLKVKLKNYENIVAKLENKLAVLESKVSDQERLLDSQAHELEALRPQVEGKKELARILADAQNLLDQEV